MQGFRTLISLSYLAESSVVSTFCAPHWRVPPPRWAGRPLREGTTGGAPCQPSCWLWWGRLGQQHCWLGGLPSWRLTAAEVGPRLELVLKFLTEVGQLQEREASWLNRGLSKVDALYPFKSVFGNERVVIKRYLWLLSEKYCNNLFQNWCQLWNCLIDK